MTQPNDLIPLAIDRLREKGHSIYETDYFYHKGNIMVDVDKPQIRDSIIEEVSIIQKELREKKIESVLN
jgi:hypothetical protein